jgi:hypothetical protein
MWKHTTEALMKRILVSVLAMLAMPMMMADRAAAQSVSNAPPAPPHLDVFGGLMLLRLTPGSDLDRAGVPGWQAALTVYPFGGDRWVSRLGFAAEVVGAQRTPALDDAQVPGAKVQLTENTFLFGPTLRLVRRERFSSNLRVLVGVARLRTGFPSDLAQDGIAPGETPGGIGVFEDDNAFAASVGSAWEIRVSRVVAVRLSPSMLITRFHGETQLAQRFSTGLVFRWYRHDERAR